MDTGHALNGSVRRPVGERQVFIVGNRQVCGDQGGQSLEPEAGCLDLAMPELPRLDDLVRLANLGTDHADRVLDGDAVNRRIEEGTDKGQRIHLLLGAIFKPSCPADG